MKKIEQFLLKYKWIVLLAVGIVFAVTVVGTVFLVNDESKINSDMVSYLDNDSKTKRGLVFLQDEFEIRGNATLVVRVDENDESDVTAFRRAVQNVENMEKVSSLTWYGSVSSYETIDTGLAEILAVLHENEPKLRAIAQTLKEENIYDNADRIVTLLALADYFGVDFVDTSAMESYLRHPTGEDGVYDYVLIVLTDIDAGNDAYALLASIKSEFEYTEYAISGTTETARKLLDETMKDLPWFILVGVGSVLVILLLCTRSFLEPYILLFTLLVGILISMGINYLFPSISIISFAISAVLQLAITMDYAIFFMHAYRRKRKEYAPDVAATEAFPEVAESVLASGFTTVGGFVALYCMQFRIGTDIANVLVKGVLTSVLTVLLVQPILTVLLDKFILKSSHDFTGKILAYVNQKRVAKGKAEIDANDRPVSGAVGKFSVWARIVLVVLAAALIVPSFLAQRSVQFSYLELYEKKNETTEDALANELGNQLILAVPVRTLKDTQSQKEFIGKVRAVNPDRITGMLGVFTAVDIDEEITEALLALTQDENATDLTKLRRYLSEESYLSVLHEYGITDEDVEPLLALCDAALNVSENVDTGLLRSFFKNVDGAWYTIYTVSFSGNTEDDEAQRAYEDVCALCKEYFGEDAYYPVGMITSSNEMGAITPRDFLVVTLVSVAIIYLIVTLLLRNPLKSLFALIIIELGIWVNLALSFLLHESVNFIVYVIISSVQLGCTVDYAILFANTFEKNRDKYATGKECAAATIKDTLPAILTSALMIGSVCFGMYLVSGNLVIRQLTGMLARGALISFLLVTFVQTAVWSFFKTARKRRNYEEKIAALEQANERAGGDATDATASTENAKEKPARKEKKKLSAAEKLALLEQEDNEKK